MGEVFEAGLPKTELKRTEQIHTVNLHIDHNKVSISHPSYSNVHTHLNAKKQQLFKLIGHLAEWITKSCFTSSQEYLS